MSGQTILDTFFNDIHAALNGDLVGRNNSGIATAGQGLGTNALPYGTAHIDNIILGGSAIDASLLTAPVNRIVSGKTRSASNQPQFLLPNGAAASFVLEGASTNLVLDIDGAAVTVSTDITKSSLTVGPSSSATCTVDDASASDQESTKTWGEFGAEKETITVDNMGAEFQTFIGQWVAIQIAGVGTEYALAFVKSTTELTNCYRGYFTNSSSNPVNRTGFTDGDTITVLSTGWVFVENDGATVDVSYTNPITSFVAPSGSATGDYWQDLGSTNTYKRFDGASFQIINRTLVGVVAIDSSNCVAARSFDFFAKFSDENNAELEILSTSVMQLKNQDVKVNIVGIEQHYRFNHENWNITTDLAATTDLYNSGEQASTEYYLYLKDTGETAISDISPYYRPDLRGWYSPHNPWRCVGVVFNDSSSNITIFDDALYNLNIPERVVYAQLLLQADGGSTSSQTIHVRVINTLNKDGGLTDDGAAFFASLDSNQITLLGGIGNKYDIEVKSISLRPGAAAQALFYDATNSATLIEGESNTDLGDLSTMWSEANGTIVLPSTIATEIHQYTRSAQATNGLGDRTDNEVGNTNTFSKFVYAKITKRRR